MKGFLQGAKTNLSTARSLFRFLMKHKMWWMVPMIAVLVIFFVILLVGQATPLGPFIYAIF